MANPAAEHAAEAGEHLVATVEDHAGETNHTEPSSLGLAPGGWVGLSMLVFLLILIWKKVPSLITSMLDNKIAGIRQMLDEAATLRKEAEALKTEFEQKLVSAARDAEEITAAAHDEAKHILEKAEKDAADLVVRRERMAEEKIAAAELAAIADLRKTAANTAAKAALDLIRKNHSVKADAALVDEAISSI